MRQNNFIYQNKTPVYINFFHIFRRKFFYMDTIPTHSYTGENDGIADPFERFLKFITGGSVLLIFAAVFAVVWANIYPESYDHFWHTYFAVDASIFTVRMSVLHWINDGLMAIFFFVVGLEIKREFLAGEMSTVKQASLLWQHWEV